MRRKYLFTTTCESIPQDRVQDLFDMYDRDRDITRRTFIKWAGKENAAPRWDQYVRYSRSVFRGRKCVVMEHSAIDHIFCEPSDDRRHLSS